MIDLIAARLSNELLVGSTLIHPEDVVRRLGAVQAQEYAHARWGLAQRLASATDAAIAQAFDDGRILRTHVLRPTWHFVTPEDIRWILSISRPRVHAANGYSYRTNNLDDKTRTRAAQVIVDALEGHKHLTRTEIAAALKRARLPSSGQALGCLLMHAELEALICSGPRRGKQFTYALVDERAPIASSLEVDDALAELAFRYFTSHGPATVRDFVWWSGLTVAQAKTGIDVLGRRLQCREIDGKMCWFGAEGAPHRVVRPIVHLLPIYDEFLIAFKDREWSTSLVPPDAGRPAISSFYHQLVVDGRVEGSWTRTLGREEVTIEVTPFSTLSPAVWKAVHAAANRYGLFLGLPATVTLGR